MKLDDYLVRIGYEGRVAPDAACLATIHRQHLLSIPYEDLDIQLGRPLDMDPERIFEKLVVQRRGGWCYEMNGLLCWALREVGFEVTRLVGGVMRVLKGDDAMGNHLVLRVEAEGPMLADAGLGDGILEPVALAPGRSPQGEREFRLEVLDDGLWRFHNHAGVFPTSFDFSLEPDEDQLAAACRKLQEDATSIFRQNLICMLPNTQGEAQALIGRVLALPGEEKKILASADEFCEALDSVFGLRDPLFSSLWPQVVARHRELFGEKGPDEISLDDV